MSGDNPHPIVGRETHQSSTPLKLVTEALAAHRPVAIIDQNNAIVDPAHASICRQGTLYDMAKADLAGAGTEPTQREIYKHLNDIMKTNSLQPAALENRKHVSDKMLPRSWNDIPADECFLKAGLALHFYPLRPPMGTQE